MSQDNNHNNSISLPPPPPKVSRSSNSSSGRKGKDFFASDESSITIKDEDSFTIKQDVYRSVSFIPDTSKTNKMQAMRSAHLNKIISKTGLLKIDSPSGISRTKSHFSHLQPQHTYDLGSPACASDDGDGTDIIEIPFLPPYPFKLEKNTHVSIASDLIAARDLVNLINENLRQTGADFHFNNRKGKWKGAVYKGNRFVNFRIYLYKNIDESTKSTDPQINETNIVENDHEDSNTDEENDLDDDLDDYLPFHYIIEFQRRHGEPLQYSILWKDFITELQKQDLIKDIEANSYLNKNYLSPSPRVHEVPLLDSPSVNLNNTNNTFSVSNDDREDYTKPLVEMCQSPCRHLNLEALRSMAQLSADEDNHNLFQRSQAIGAIAKLLHSPSAEVRQFSASVLSNLSESSMGQNSIVEVGAIPSLLKVLARMTHQDSYIEIEMQRESARTLANLCPRFSKQILDEIKLDKDIYMWVASADSLNDERLRMHACRILKVFTEHDVRGPLDTLA